MVKVNDNYLKLPGSYLFSTIGKKVNAYMAANPDKKVIRLGIGDVTQPLSPAVISALHGAVDEMADAKTFRGYAPDLGYPFLRETIAREDYEKRGCDVKADEIFISDGAKSDCGNIQELFGPEARIAVCDPGLPGVCGLQCDGGTRRGVRSLIWHLVKGDLPALYQGKQVCPGAPEGNTRYDLSVQPQ